MKTVKEIISEFREQKIKLILKGDNLEIISYNNKLSKEQIELLKSNKKDIIQYLREIDRSESMSYIPNVSIDSNYPLSNSQYRLWILSQSKESSIAYNMPSNIRLNGDYDIDLFSKAIYSVINRHEILRTVFKENEEGEVRQWILDRESLGFNIKYKDLRSTANRETAIKTYIDTDSGRPFDLETGPLLRASLLQYSDDEYVFYYCMHHIISDGWSMDILSRDVMSFYKSFLTDTENTLPPLRIQYKDHTAWQLSELESKAYGVHEEYWLSKLKGTLPVIDFPGQRRRPKTKTYNGVGLISSIPQVKVSKLKNFVRLAGGSIFTLLLASFKVLLYRYTNERDLIVGIPVAGRDNPDLEDQIGFYINVLALRSELFPDEQFDKFYQRVKEDTMISFDHQTYPFDCLMDKLSLQRDVSRNPVFDVFLDYRVSSESNSRKLKEGEIINIGACTVKYDLVFQFMEMSDGIDILAKYNSDVYEPGIVPQFLKHFELLLNNILEYPQKVIGSINYLSNQEELDLLSCLEIQEKTVRGTILDLFKKQVALKPDEIALLHEGRMITFSELDKLSNQLANCLLTKNSIEKESIVGIKIEQSDWLVISVLGILKAGAAYLPLSDSLSWDRESYMLEDSGVKLIVTSSLFMMEYSHYEGVIFAIDIELDSDEYSTGEIKNELLPHELAYVIYTSGSTGTPKATLIEHGSLLNYLEWGSSYYSHSDLKSLSFGLFTPLSFDLTVTSLFLPILNGGVLDIFPNNSDVSQTLKNYVNSDISGIKLTPAHIMLLANMELKNENLKFAIVGGDELQKKHIAILKSINPAIRIYNEYGPTEATVGCTISLIESEDTIDIGKPISNTQIFILNENHQLEPIGVVGELCVSGHGLARGYLNNDDLTATKFVPHPFKKGDRLYKTGDLARWLPNGNIQYIGRKDNQVKVRGYRIELGEIEHYIGQYPTIKDTVVVTAQNEEDNKELVAYIVSDDIVNQSELRVYLSSRLPNYMLPHYFVPIDAIPLTSNGKIDSASLPNPYVNLLKEDVSQVLPRTEEEKVLMATWELVLKHEGISVKDSFYNLGGDSIKSIQISSRLREQGYKLTITDIMAEPILELLALKMQRINQVIDQSTVIGEVKLTPIQYFFFENTKIKVPHHFNQSVVLRSKETVDSDILGRCISDLVTHHDALRMIYKKEEFGWVQYNQDISPASYSVSFYDLRKEENELNKMSTLGEELQSSFDLSTGPLFKVGHFRLSDGDRLALICHHLLVDGVSWRILLEDLSTLYSQYQLGNKTKLPSKTDSFQRWATLQKEHAHSKMLIDEKAYWEEVLEQKIIDLPVDGKEENTNFNINSEMSFTLDKDITDMMQTSIHTVYNTEINDILLTGLGLAIKDVFGIEKSVLKMEGHGREEIMEDVDISRTVGWFTSVYPFVLHVPNSSKITSNLILVKEALRKIPNKGIGYGMVKYLKNGLDSEFNPSITFNYLGDFGSGIGDEKDSVFEYGSENIGAFSAPENVENIQLSVSGMLTSGKLRMSIEYSKERYKEETIQSLINAYRENLTALIIGLSKETKSYLTPSDLTFKGLTIDELSSINEKYDIEDAYNLSPLQQGIYYHWLLDSNSSLYFEQMSYRLRVRAMDMKNVYKACDQLIAMHSVLRTSFTNDYTEIPLQIVHKTVPGKCIYKQVSSGLNDDELKAYIESVKLDDRLQGFDLEDKSQMRLIVLDLGNEEYEFVWSFHHILMDGWCISVLINDFLQLLNGISKNVEAQLPKPKPFSDYIKWLNNIGTDSSLDYWKTYLNGYQRKPRLPYMSSHSRTDKYDRGSHEFLITLEKYNKINELCVELRITQNTFLMALWGIILAKYNGTQDIVFGSIVSGRPEDLEDIESMVGLFANVIPVRIKFDEYQTLKELIIRVHEESINSKPYHYSNISDVQGQSELGKDLMDHVLVFSNYPIQELVEEKMDDFEENAFELSSVEVFEQTNYDFHIDFMPSSEGINVNLLLNKNKYSTNAMFLLEELINKMIDQMLLKIDSPIRDIKIEDMMAEKKNDSHNISNVDLLIEENF